MPSTDAHRDVGVAVEVRAFIMAGLVDALITMALLVVLRVCGWAYFPAEAVACPTAVYGYIRMYRWITGGAPFVD